MTGWWLTIRPPLIRSPSLGKFQRRRDRQGGHLYPRRAARAERTWSRSNCRPPARSSAPSRSTRRSTASPGSAARSPAVTTSSNDPPQFGQTVAEQLLGIADDRVAWLLRRWVQPPDFRLAPPVTRGRSRWPGEAGAWGSSPWRRVPLRSAATGCTLTCRSPRTGAPVFIWPQFSATARSAMTGSSVSPEPFRHAHAVNRGGRHRGRVERLREGADLIDLPQQRVGRTCSMPRCSRATAVTNRSSPMI